MPKTVFMMYGLPASGKSTRAKEMLREFGAGNAKRVNKDDLRAMIDDGKWTRENEKFVLSIRDSIIATALQQGKHVIVDDTNLAPKHQAVLRQLAKDGGAAFEVVDFSNVPLDECVERDRKRANYVGEKVIRGMYEQFLAPEIHPVPYSPALPNVMIVDVDGTVATMINRGPFDWDKVDTDAPRYEVIRAILNYGYPWIFLSGRDECCRVQTEQWLGKYFGNASQLYMRPAGDMRKDCIIKREIYEREIEGKYNVRAIWDDRPQVIRLWQSLGFADRIFNVGEGKEF